jgi:hypothetical protein
MVYGMFLNEYSLTNAAWRDQKPVQTSPKKH